MKPSIAVLVDGDQFGPEPMPDLMHRLEADWTVAERVCVRNWRSTRDQQAWREFAADHSFRLIQRDPVAAGKNASDIELAVIAMDLLAAGHRAFCLVSGDMDFTPLVDRLRRGGCHVDWVRPADMMLRGRGRRTARPAGRTPAPSKAAGEAAPARRSRRGGKASAAAVDKTPGQGAGGRGAATSGASRQGSGRSTNKAASGRGSGADAARAPGSGGASGAKGPSGAAGQAGAGRGGAGAARGGAGAARGGASAGQGGKSQGAKTSSAGKGPDKEGFARAVRRTIAELRRAGEHERGWVSVNRLGSKLTEAGTNKDDFGFPKRRPLWAALQEAGFEAEQMETGQYRVTV